MGDDTNADGLVDLVGRDVVPEGPNQLWLTDITYIRLWSGWAYLASIIDGYSRKVVGWSVESHMRTSLVTDAVRMAIDNRRPPFGQTVVHSDRGSQYTSQAFRNLALAHGIIPSMGTVGDCFDCETVLRHPSWCDPCYDWPCGCPGVDLLAGSGDTPEVARPGGQ